MIPHPEACVTCGDVAVAGRVVEVAGLQAIVQVDASTERVEEDAG